MSQTNNIKEKEDNYKIFEQNYNNNFQKFAVIKTNSLDIEDAGIEYARMFNICVKKGISTNNKLLQELIKSGSWTNESQERMAFLEQKIDDSRIELENLRKIDKPSKQDKQQADDLVINIKNYVEELNSLIMERNDLLANSADAKAEESRRAYLIACSVYKVKQKDEKDILDGRLWNSYKEYQDDNNQIFKGHCFLQYIYFMGNIDSNEKTSENKPHPWEENLLLEDNIKAKKK